MDGNDQRVIKALGSINEIAQADWDACAGTDNPFVRYAFLSALEDSGSATDETGWIPRHLVIETPDLSSCMHSRICTTSKIYSYIFLKDLK